MDVSFSWSEDILGGYSFFSQHDEQNKEYFNANAFLATLYYNDEVFD